MRNYRLVNNVLGWIVFVIASCVYLMTIEPTGSFWDCGEFITSAFKLEVGHPPGAPFFMLVANLFTHFASSTAEVGKMVNVMSALFSGLTILFLFWSITHLARKVMLEEGEAPAFSQLISIMGCGLVGALVYTFSDTFWFSAVEGEVYAFSSLFTAVVFWLILKWEDSADSPHADRWIVLIAYLMGLSIGVHLLNLLCIPAIVLVYYYKKFPNPTMKGTLIALVISFAMVALMMYGVVQGLVEICGLFELLFVNILGMPYNSGVYIYIIVVAAVLLWAVWETMQDRIHPVRMKIAFLLSIILLGIPFIGNGYILGILLIIALAAYLFKAKNLNIKLLNTSLLSLMVIVVGYSSYALILIRATADTPMNQNTPSDIFTLRTYLAREQYGDTPLLYGQTFASEVKRESKGGLCTAVTKEGNPTWSRVIKKDKKDKDHYYISRHDVKYEYVDELNMLFPRMYSTDGRHVEAYKEWSDFKGTPVKYNRCGETMTAQKPTFAENIRFFFAYQLNFMYWRYFMWNFSGRQNDIQGNGEVMNGNWITGIKFIDEVLVGPQDNMPYDIVNNKGHNVYYMLPLLLGILGLLYQAYAGKKGIQGFWVTFALFFMTGIAIVLYLNQTPYQPRERDYAYAGSFYAFCIWIGFGVAAIAKGLEKYLKMPAVAASAFASLAALVVPIQMAGQTWDDHDRSGRYVARDFGSNYLESCAPNAVIFTNGDNDTFPLWYAQEVEGIRTDVRVCNTSYLQTDWYIDQMKRQAYHSDPLPISWTRADYIQGTRDIAYVMDRMGGQPVGLGDALDFVRSNDPKAKQIPGYSEQIDYIPATTLVYPVDTAAALSSGTVRPVDAPSILPQMTIDLKSKTILGKQELIILDMLRTNNWKRPIYYAITVSPDQFAGLDPYFQQTGLTYQVVPLQAKDSRLSVNTDQMYDNVMNKFKWGGIDKPGVYLDENVMRMCKSYRMALFGKLAESLINEGKKDKALTVLDKSIDVLQNVTMDYTGLSIGEMYYALGQKEKAEKVYDQIADYTVRNIDWIFRLNPLQRASVQRELQHNLAVLQEIIRTSHQYDPEYGQKFHKQFEVFSQKYAGSVKKD